jgi:hypothetical protein
MVRFRFNHSLEYNSFGNLEDLAFYFNHVFAFWFSCVFGLRV